MNFTDDELDLLLKALDTLIDVNAEVEEEDGEDDSIAEESELASKLLKKIKKLKN